MLLIESGGLSYVNSTQ